MRFKQTVFKTVCTSCGLEAQRVESVLEEREYGDMLCVLIVGRMFYHIYENGTKKTCRHNLPNPWIMTLCGMDEAEKARAAYKREVGRQQIVTGLRVV